MNDLLFTVPRRLLGAFNASVGSHAGASAGGDGQCGCFDGGRCPGRPALRRVGHLITGHDCYNVLAARLALEQGAAEPIGFCWPAVSRSVHEANAVYALPRCADIDASVHYAARACSKQGRGRSAQGGRKLMKMKARG